MPEVTTPFSQALYYEKKGSGPALVLLHGFPENGSLWDGQAEALAARFTLIIPDLPGSGRSPLPVGLVPGEVTGCVSLSQMAEAIKAILDAEGINRAVIAGHSMGGYVALAFAKLYPTAVAGLSLVHSTPLADDDVKKQMRQKAIELIRNGGKAPFLRQMVAGLFSDSFKQTANETVEAQIAKALVMSDDGLVNFYLAMKGREERVDVLAAATFPVQWIMGEDDTVVPYKKNIPYSYRAAVNFVIFYKQCAHMAMYEAPERLAGDILDFTGYCYNLK